MKSSTGNGVDAEFNEITCISDFKMLTLSSETSIYSQTAKIDCHYLMTLSVFCGTQFKRAEVKHNFGYLPFNWSTLLGTLKNGSSRFVCIWNIILK